MGTFNVIYTYQAEGKPVCGDEWKSRLFPITRGLLPATVLIWKDNSDFQIAEITNMAYTPYHFILM